MTYEYENTRRISYEGGAVFIPVCPICNQFVKADEKIKINMLGELAKEPNATCTKHGRIQMPFEGFI